MDKDNEINIILRQYSEEQMNLQPFEGHGMKPAPKRSIDDIIRDLKQIDYDKDEVERNLNEIQKFVGDAN